MTRFFRRNTRMLFTVVLALAALGLGVTQAIANSTHNLPIFLNHDDCASPGGNHTIGTATVNFKDGTLKIRVRINANAPGSSYELRLFDTYCDEIGNFGYVNAGSTKTFTLSQPSGRYFIDMVGGGHANETDWFTV